MTPRTSFGSNNSRRSRAVCLNGRDNVMNSMTIRAYGRARHTTRHCLSVNTLYELRTLTLMALAARPGNVDFGNGRLWIGGGQDVVTVMTVGTHSSADIALRDRLCVHTLSIRKKGTLTDATALHH